MRFFKVPCGCPQALGVAAAMERDETHENSNPGSPPRRLGRAEASRRTAGRIVGGAKRKRRPPPPIRPAVCGKGLLSRREGEDCGRGSPSSWLPSALPPAAQIAARAAKGGTAERRWLVASLGLAAPTDRLLAAGLGFSWAGGGTPVLGLGRRPRRLGIGLRGNKGSRAERRTDGAPMLGTTAWGHPQETLKRQKR